MMPLPILAGVAGEASRRQALLRADCVELVHAISIPPAKGLRRCGCRQSRKLRPARGRSGWTGSATRSPSPGETRVTSRSGSISVVARHPQGRPRIIATTSPGTGRLMRCGRPRPGRVGTLHAREAEAHGAADRDDIDAG